MARLGNCTHDPERARRRLPPIMRSFCSGTPSPSWIGTRYDRAIKVYLFLVGFFFCMTGLLDPKSSEKKKIIGRFVCKILDVYLGPAGFLIRYGSSFIFFSKSVLGRGFSPFTTGNPFYGDKITWIYYWEGFRGSQPHYNWKPVFGDKITWI